MANNVDTFQTCYQQRKYDANRTNTIREIKKPLLYQATYIYNEYGIW